MDQLVFYTGMNSRSGNKKGFESEVLSVFQNVEFCHTDTDTKGMYGRLQKLQRHETELVVVFHRSCSQKIIADREAEIRKKLPGFKMTFKCDHEGQDAHKQSAVKGCQDYSIYRNNQIKKNEGSPKKPLEILEEAYA